MTNYDYELIILTQQIINQDFGDDYDIFIGIIWKKFGTKTEVAESGTEEEFLRALKRFENGENIQILFYFKSEPIPFDEINPEQILKIKNFKEGQFFIGILTMLKN